MARPVDEVFDNDFLASLYDDLNPWGPCDDFYLQQARECGGPILDLGCGTGMLACRIAAAGLEVYGADPAAGMLKVARSRPGTDRVTWIASSGQNLDLPQRFRLIYMTGHAFQALLTDEDAVGVLRGAARHLAAGGRFMFDIRNPAAREWLEWTPENAWVVEIAGQGRVEESDDASFDPATGILTIAHRYRFLDRGTERVAHSRIRFVDKEHLARLIAEAGLTLLALYGFWDRRPVTSESREIIAVTGRTP